jgi:predicted esterase
LILVRWFAAALIITELLVACVNSSHIIPDSSAPPLPVTTFLYTTDPQEAIRLFEELLNHPIPEILEALKAQRNYPAAPTGRLPEQTVTLNGEENLYGLYVPKDYQPARAYPLVICLHGAGFDGSSYLDRWQPRLGERYLLACPTMEAAAWWTPKAQELVLAVQREVMRNYHVDPDRVFLSGMSNGGIGTYLIGLNHVDRFAALIPMAGALPDPLLPLLDNARATPFYIIHGSKDQVIPVKFSQTVRAYLMKQGYSVVYREHDQVHPMAGGHFFPREELPALVDWLETQRRIHTPKKITIVRDRDHAGRSYWIRIDEIDPEVGSFWLSEQNPEETRHLAEGLYARMDAKIVPGNRIEVTAQHVRRYTVLLNDQLVDMNHPVRIVTNGKLSFEGKIVPDAGVLLEEARRRPDTGDLVLAAVEIEVK